MPVAENLSAWETLRRVWYWARIELWPPVPLLEKKKSLLQSAQQRVNFGCVLFVTGVASERGQGDMDLFVQVRSGVSKRSVHKVRVEYLGLGEAAMPWCDCVNARLVENWKWCAHMLAVVFVTERVRLGFERVVYSDSAREFVSQEHRDEFLHVAELYQVKQAERILRDRLEEQAMQDGLWAGSKIAYLRGFSLRSYELEDTPIHVQLVVPGEEKEMRKRREKKGKKAKREKKEAVKKEKPVVEDVSSESEAKDAVVPRKKDRRMSDSEFRDILALNAGRKRRKSKRN